MQIYECMTRAIVVAALVTLVLAGCNGNEHAHDGGADHPHGTHSGAAHDEHAGANGHAHGQQPTRTITKFGEHTELYLQMPALVAGATSELTAYVTALDGYRPIQKATVSVILTSQQAPGENWKADEPVRPGLFTAAVTPKYSGERLFLVVVETDEHTERFNLDTFQVFESRTEARQVNLEGPQGEISFPKEQQWKLDFALAEATVQTMRPSVSVNATLRPAAGGDAVITAPFDGRVSAPSRGVPEVGQSVEVGQIVAYVIPRLAAGEISKLRSELRKAKVKLERTRREVERIAGLVESGAVPEKRLADAKSEEEIAQAEVKQAERRLRQYHDLESHRVGVSGRVAIRSPIAGTVVLRTVVDGGFVSSGERLLRVVDQSKLWLEAHVPEADLPRIETPTGVWFEPGGTQPPVEIDVTDEGELISFANIIDPETRATPLIFSLGTATQDNSLRVGSFVTAHILSGEPASTLTIPGSAVLDEKGLDVVFVVKSGESFERRTVRLGMRDRGRVQVIDGLEAGEWVVSEGSYFVKLASTSTGAVGHGHAH